MPMLLIARSPATLAVGLDADDAALGERVERCRQHAHRVEDAEADRRLEGVELELAALGAERDGEIVADDEEGDLVNDLGDHRVDLARHDRGAGLHRRQADLAEARARPA